MGSRVWGFLVVEKVPCSLSHLCCAVPYLHPFFNVLQLEMSKQDDRASEESANQTSVSQREEFCSMPTASLILFCLQLLTPHYSSLSTIPDFPLSPLPAESLQANVIVCDCVCPWINHSDTTGLENKGHKVRTAHKRANVCMSADTRSLGFMEELKTGKAH